MAKSQKSAESEVRAWGFNRVVTWTDAPNAYYSPHTHEGLTTHLILKGQMTVLYPKDPDPKKETSGPGARVDIGAGKEHEVWISDEGCTMVIGE